MIEITEAAMREFKKIIAAESNKGKVVRLALAAGGCCGPALGIDIVDKGKPGDVKFKSEECPVFIEKRSFTQLDAATLDYINQGVQEGFFLKGLQRGSCCG